MTTLFDPIGQQRQEQLEVVSIEQFYLDRLVEIINTHSYQYFNQENYKPTLFLK